MDYQALLNALSAHADPEQARAMSAYMRDQFPYLGIPAPLRRRLSRPFLAAGKKQPPNWHFINTCWQNPYRELQYVALDYLQLVRAQLTSEDLPALKALALSKSWWDSIDNLDRLIGGIALNHPQLNATLLAWSQDDNLWLRRLAIDHQLLRKEKTDTALLETILCNNLGSDEFFINKAIGWALRDYSKTNPGWVRAFIARHRCRMSPLSLREAGKYLA